MVDLVGKLVSKIIRIEPPSANLVFLGVLVSYFLIVSGIVYDIIVEPPAMGQTQDPKTGAVRPQPIMPYRINSQYIIEGLVAGFLYTLGGLSILALNWGVGKNVSQKYKPTVLGCASFMLMLSYYGIIMFVQIKLPGYMK